MRKTVVSHPQDCTCDHCKNEEKDRRSDFVEKKNKPTLTYNPFADAFNKS